MGSTSCDEIVFSSYVPFASSAINISNKSFYKSAGLQAYSGTAKSLNSDYLSKIVISNMKSDTISITDEQIQAYWT